MSREGREGWLPKSPRGATRSCPRAAVRVQGRKPHHNSSTAPSICYSCVVGAAHAGAVAGARQARLLGLPLPASSGRSGSSTCHAPSPVACPAAQLHLLQMEQAIPSARRKMCISATGRCRHQGTGAPGRWAGPTRRPTSGQVWGKLAAPRIAPIAESLFPAAPALKMVSE